MIYHIGELTWVGSSFSKRQLATVGVTVSTWGPGKRHGLAPKENIFGTKLW